MLRVTPDMILPRNTWFKQQRMNYDEWRKAKAVLEATKERIETQEKKIGSLI